MELTYKFTNKEVTPCGGMVFLKQFLDQIKFLSKYNLAKNCHYQDRIEGVI
jgi:hypothetical protein